jgi:hypothetical protein
MQHSAGRIQSKAGFSKETNLFAASMPILKWVNFSGNFKKFFLKEKLIRTKLLLDQSQNNRKKDLEENKRLKLKIEYFEANENKNITKYINPRK